MAAEHLLVPLVRERLYGSRWRRLLVLPLLALPALVVFGLAMLRRGSPAAARDELERVVVSAVDRAWHAELERLLARRVRVVRTRGRPTSSRARRPVARGGARARESRPRRTRSSSRAGPAREPDDPHDLDAPRGGGTA